MQLHEFLTSNREQLVTNCRKNAARRFIPTDHVGAFTHGVPLFLQQLADTLRAAHDPLTRSIDPVSTPAPVAIGLAAALHGAESLRLGGNVDQVVHDYGDICQCVTALAVEQHVAISTAEFGTLNRFLDDAIAGAVTSFAEGRQASNDRRAESGQKLLDAFAVEHRRIVDIAIQSLAAIQTGSIGITGATGKLLNFALQELRSLTDRSLPEIRLASASDKAESA